MRTKRAEQEQDENEKKNSRKHERNIAEKRIPDYDIDLVIAKMNHNWAGQHVAQKRAGRDTGSSTI